MHEFEDFIERTLNATDLEELGQVFLEALQQEGFENYVLARVSAFQLRDVPISHFPDGYLAYYRDQKFERIDPVIDLSIRAATPFCWNDLLPRTLSKKQREFMAECRAIGVHSGITMPFHGPGNRVDLVSISKREKKPLNRRRLPLLYALGAQVWQRGLELGLKDASPLGEPIPRLSTREIECLAWSRDGVSYQDIGERLNISHRTVEFHMYSAMRKLGVRDKVTAVVKAIHFGLI